MKKEKKRKGKPAELKALTVLSRSSGIFAA